MLLGGPGVCVFTRRARGAGGYTVTIGGALTLAQSWTRGEVGMTPRSSHPRRATWCGPERGAPRPHAARRLRWPHALRRLPPPPRGPAQRRDRGQEQYDECRLRRGRRRAAREIALRLPLRCNGSTSLTGSGQSDGAISETTCGQDQDDDVGRSLQHRRRRGRTGQGGRGERRDESAGTTGLSREWGPQAAPRRRRIS